MLTRLLCFALTVAMPFLTCAQVDTVTASFTSVDSVCAGTPIKFTNTSVGAANYYWSFCSAGFNTTPVAINIGNPNNTLSAPVFMDYSLDDNGNYYGFSTNYNYGHLIRLNFGKSLLNNPTAEDLGTLNVIPPYAEGVQVKKSNGNCYVFVVSAGNEYGTASTLIRVEFGNSFSNTPSNAIDLGNIGGMNFPHELFISQDHNNFYGFTVNINDNSITRFDFGNDLGNQPTGTNLGNIGNLNYPCGFSFVNFEGNWYSFITNRNNNSISRLSFGNSLSNTPTGLNIGNPGGILYRPRDISIFESCSGIVGLVVNEEDETTGEITKLDFGSNILSTTPIATNLGNLGQLQFPHSISKFFLDGNDIYSFITNVSNNTITRLRYVGCTSSSVPSSTQKTPPSITYTEPGTYNVNLLVDIGLPTETSFCKQIVVEDCTPKVTAGFTAPDSVCINTPVKITNTSTNATSYYWSFCQADLNKKPEGENLGNINSALSLPTYSDIALQNGNYYVFVVNNYPASINRLDFGNSLLNVPTQVSLGNFGGVLESGAEGIQVINTGNHWYGIIVGGTISINGVTPQIIKLDFGTDLTNALPVATNWGNIGNMSYPHELYVFTENSNWYGFTANYDNNTITRFDFGQDFSNPPTGTNLGSFGLLNGPTGLSPIKDNTNWYLFITNGTNNTITRLNFGQSLLNTPTAFNLGNLNGTMHKCWDISIQKYCDQIIGFVINGDDSYNDIVRLDFNNNLLSVPTATSIGNIGQLSFPHSFSKLFRVGNDLYNFIPNAHNNTLTRLKFSGCNNSSIPNTTQATPPAIKYDSAGVYNISLSVDEGLPTQTSFCKQIVVKNCINPCDSFKVNAGKDTSICYGSSVQLKATGATTYKWIASSALSDTTIANPVAKPLTTSQFIVTGSNTSGCSDTDTVKVTVLPLPVFSINNDTSICTGSTVNLLATGNGTYHYHWVPATYLSDTSIVNPVASPTDTISYIVTATDSNTCRSNDTVQINVVPVPVVSTINDASICLKDSITLTTTATDATKFVWNPSTGLNSNSTQSPKAYPVVSTNYTVTASNSLCSSKDSVHISVLPLPTVFAGNDTTTCGIGTAQLHASGAVSYSWSPTNNLSSPNSAVTIASPTATTTFYVTGVGANACHNKDSVIVFKEPDPVFSVVPIDSSICSGQKIILSASGGDTYNWSPPQTLSSSTSATTVASPLSATKYLVVIYDSTCKVSSTLSSTISINASPIVSILKSNDVDCSNPQAQLTATGGATYNWLPATNITDTQIANPVVNPTSDTWYSVTVTNTNGCVTRDSILVKSTLGNQGMYVPNAFTPNGDGRNDCFGVHYWGQATSFDMKIFDKWGMMIYHTQNVGECWDGSYKGKKQGSGTFVYMIKAASACGKQDIFRKGTVVLIR